MFRSIADIVDDDTGSFVEGMVFRITPRYEADLDRHQGFPNLYRTRIFSATLGDDPITVMFYVMNDSYIAPPPDAYLQTIETGYYDWKISPENLDVAFAASVACRAKPAKRKRLADPSGDGRGRLDV